MRGITRTLGALFAASALAAPVWAGVFEGEPTADFSCSFDGPDTPSGWISNWNGEYPTSAWVSTPNDRGFLVTSSIHPHSSNSTGWPNTGSYSLAFYGKLPTVTGNTKLVVWGMGSKTDGVIVIEQTANGPQLEYLKGTTLTALVDGTGAVSEGYHLIVVTVSVENSNTTFSLYVDGSQVGSSVTKTSTEVACTDSAFQVGAVYGGLANTVLSAGAGIIVDEIRGYNSVLTSGQITTLKGFFPVKLPLTRTVTGNSDWSASGVWMEGSSASTQAVPEAWRNASLEVTADATMTLNAAATVDTLTVGGSNELIFAATGNNRLTTSAVTANTDVDLSAVTASLGAVTIAADKTLTVGALDGITSSSGSGALAVKLATAGTTATLNYQPQSALTLAQGQLSIGGAKLANASTIRVEGTGSRMICTENDPMNSQGTYAGKLELSDGAILETQKHTRLPQTVEFSGTGSQVQITGTNDNAWRAVSLRTVKLLANATATFTRAGNKASSDDAGFHLWNTTINAATGAILTIDAPLMKGCNNSGLSDSESSLTKTGAGELIVTAPSVASDFKLPACTIAVNEGKLTLKPAAATTTMDFGSASITVASGAELVYAGEGTSAVTAPISGEGALKVISGTLDLHSNTFGDTVPSFAVESGATLILPAGRESGVVLASGASLKLVLSRAQLSADYTLQVGEADRSKVTLQKVDSNGQLTNITDADGTVTDGVFTPAMTTWTPTVTETGGSYSWSNASNWSKGLPKADVPARIKVLEATTIVVPANAICSALYLNGPATLTLAGEAPRGLGALTVVGNAAVPVALANAVSSIAVEADYTLTLDAGADGATLTQPIAVAGAIKKVGSGTLTLGENLAPDGGTTVAEGTLAFGAGVIPYSGANLAYTSAGNVTVEGGATLDVAGVKDAYLYTLTLKEGATYANSSTTALGSNARQLRELVLEGDATVAATSDFGIVRGGFEASVLNLNGHTLTKTGEGKFWLCKTAVSGGTLKVSQGTIKSVQENSTIDGDIVFDCGSSDTAFDFAGQQVTVNGAVTKRGKGTMTCDAILAGNDKVLTVEEGTLKLTKANTRIDTASTGTNDLVTTVIKPGATLDVSDEAATLYSAEQFGGNQNSVSVLVQGKLITREWNYGQALGALRVNTATVELDGGTVEFTTDVSSTDRDRRAFKVTANGGILIARDAVTVALNPDMGIANNGTLNLTGAGAFAFPVIPGAVTVSSTVGGTGSFSGTLTFANGAKLDVTNGALTAGTVAFAENATVTVAGATASTTTILNCSNPAAVATKLTGAPTGYTFAANEAGTAVVLAAVPTVEIPKVDEVPLSADSQAVLQAVAQEQGLAEVTAVSGSTTVNGTETRLTAAQIDNALAVFGESVVTVDGTELKVDYNFGIVAIEPNDLNGPLPTFTVKVAVKKADGTLASIADGAVIELVDSKGATILDGGAGFHDIDNDGMYEAYFSADPTATHTLIGRSFKVKATK